MKSTTKKYNKSVIMRRAWVIFRKENDLTFPESLKKSWYIAKNGKNNNTFEEVYNKNYNQILYFVNGWVKNMIEAEDITAKVFIKLNENFDKYDVYQAKISTYLHVIAKSMIIDFFRTNHKDKYVNVDNFVNNDGKEIFQFVDENTNDNIENDELKNSINDALNNLKPKYKEIAVLYFVKELSYKEISNILDLPMGTVKGNISRVRKMLQENLKDVRTKINAI